MKTFNLKSSLSTIVVICIALALSSCSKTTSGVSSGKKLYTDFFVGDAGTQYYIKPLGFQNSVGAKEELLMDLTFRYKDKLKDSVNVNFSVIGTTPFKVIESLMLVSQEVSVTSNDVTFLFNERSKKGFISRFSTQISLQELKKMVDAGHSWEIEIQSLNSGKKNFTASKKTIKSMYKLNQSLFILLN